MTPKWEAHTKCCNRTKIQGRIVLVANKCYLFLVSIYRIANNRFPKIMKNQLFSREQENKEKKCGGEKKQIPVKKIR
jgi:hypothetical protein